MHDEPLDPEALSPNEVRQLDERVVRTLEAAPAMVIPADFAARVASQLPARRPVSLTPTHYGERATWVGIVIALAALLVVALHTTNHAVFDVVQALLLTEFIALAVWLSVRRWSVR
jgi:hypothetical protein